MTLAGTRILVTGAASGLGAALSDAFVASGAEVLRTDLVPGPGHRSAAARRHLRGRLAARSPSTYAALGRARRAGQQRRRRRGRRIELCDLDEWRWLIDVNLLGVVRGTRAFLPVLKERPGARVVNVASLAGLVHPAGMGSYNAVKAAVVAFTETTGHELAA